MPRIERSSKYSADQVYNQKDAEGFINLIGLPLKVQAGLEQSLKK